MMLGRALPATAPALAAPASIGPAAAPAETAEAVDFMGLLLVLAGIGTSPLPAQAWGGGSDSDSPPRPPTKQGDESGSAPLDAAVLDAPGMAARAWMPLAMASTPSGAAASPAADDPGRLTAAGEATVTAFPASPLGDVVAAVASMSPATDVQPRSLVDDLAPALGRGPRIQFTGQPAAADDALPGLPGMPIERVPGADTERGTITATRSTVTSQAPAQAQRIDAAHPEMVRGGHDVSVEPATRAVNAAGGTAPPPAPPLPPASAGSPRLSQPRLVSQPVLTRAMQNTGEASDASGMVTAATTGAREPAEAAPQLVMATAVQVPVSTTEPVIGVTSGPARPVPRTAGAPAAVLRSASQDPGEEAVSSPPVPGLEPRPGDRRVGLPVAALPQPSQRDPHSANDHERADTHASALPAIEVGAVATTATRSQIAPVASRAPATEPPVVDQVVRAARLVISEGVSRLEVQLDPPTLGAIRVMAAESREGIRLTISAEQPETRALLLSALPEIQSTLAGRGLAGADVVVAQVFEDRTGPPPRRREAEREPASGRSRPDRRRDGGDAARPTATVNLTV